MMTQKRQLVLAGNWKLHHVNADLQPYFDKFFATCSESQKINLIFAVSYTLIQDCVALTSTKKNLNIFAQNLSLFQQGAYTGEVSQQMLAAVGAQGSLIGHSERRQYFNETDEEVAKKLRLCIEHDFSTIVCVGEKKEEREQGRTEQVIGQQLDAVIAVLKEHKYRAAELIIAYEPVWAIGTGLTATPEQANEVHAFIRQRIGQFLGVDYAQQLRVLYGGSVKLSNIADLVAMPHIDGGLVGGASLNPEEFATMANMLAKM